MLNRSRRPFVGRHRTSRHVARRLIVSVAVLGLVAAACGDDDGGASPSPTDAAPDTDTDTGTGTDTDSGDGSGIDVAALEVEVAAASEVPEFVPQGPPFSIADLAGKKIFAMPVASSLTGCDNMAQWVVEIARSVGMTDSLYFQNDGGPAAWQEGMEVALNGGYDGVALVCGIDPNALTPQMEAAREAGIPVVVLHLADRSVPADPLVAGQTSGEFNRSLQLGVYAALVNSGGEPIDVLMITANENPPSVGMERTVRESLDELCPDCALTTQNVPIPDWFGGAGQSTIDAALVANPDLDAVILSYDFMAPVVEGSIKANNASAKIYAFGGDAPVVATMTEPDTAFGTDMGPDFLWMAYSGADQLFRAMVGEPVIPADEAYAPYRLWSPDNAAEQTGEPGAGFGDAFLQGYYDLWLDHPASEPYQP